MIGVTRKNIYLQDYLSSFFYYIVNQKKELWNGDVALLEYEAPEMIGYVLHIDHTKTPALVTVEKAAQMAAFHGCDLFGTTLTVSPHKNYEIISAIGKDIAARYGIGFLDRDFKKQDGFKRSIELSKKYGLYRQNYCGCVYSDWRRK